MSNQVLGEANVPIRATLDKLDGDLAAARGKVEGAMGKIGQIAGGVGRSMKSIGTLALGGLGAIGGLATGAAAGMAALAASAEPLVGLQQGFAAVTERIGTSSDVMLSSLAKASGGLITNRDLMASFNKAAALVSDDFAESLPDAMSLVRRASQATGQDMGFLFDSLVTGVGRVSPMILDNLGIQVQLAEVTDRAAQMFGKSTEELSKQEQQAALTEIVMEKLTAAYGDVPDVTPVFASIKTTLANIRDEIGLKLLPVGQPLAGLFLTLADKALPPLTAALDKILPTLEKVADIFSVYIKTLASGQDPLDATEKFVYRLARAFGESKESAEDVAESVRGVIEKVQEIKTKIDEFLAPIGEFITANVQLNDILIALGLTIATVLLPIVASLVATMAPLVLTFVGIVAVVALLRTAWEENWGGIQEKAAAAWAAIQVVLQQVWEWLQVNVPKALETLRAWWVDKAWPAIQKAVEIVWPIIQQIFNLIVTWVTGTLIPTVQSLHDKWVNEIWPTIQTITENVWTVLEEIFTEIGRWINDNIVPWIEYLNQVWTETVWPAIQEALETAWGVIEPIWESLKEWLGTTLPPIIESLQSTFENVMTGINEAVQPVKDLWDAFVSAVQKFWDWITGKVFDFKINIPNLPAWALPGSPLPIHTAWKNFAGDMASMTIQPRFDLGPDRDPTRWFPPPPAAGGGMMLAGAPAAATGGDFYANVYMPPGSDGRDVVTQMARQDRMMRRAGSGYAGR